MKETSKTSVLFLGVLQIACINFTLSPGCTAYAQEANKSDEVAGTNATTTDSPVSNTSKDEAKPKEHEDDPFAVPQDATVEQLFDFVNSVKRNRGRNLESVKKSARAVADGAQAIRNHEAVEVEDEIRAIREQLGALSFLSRFDAESREEMELVIQSLATDERPDISKLAALETFKLRISNARKASKEEQQQIVADLKELIGEAKIDADVFRLANSLASVIGSTKNPEVAAALYDDLAKMMSESEDEMLQNRAPIILGAARRLRLPGNFMQVMGTTTEGVEFDWDAYRGKVVLVDFWASWCGPCRAEIPNMKQNFEAYREKGFEIVGINLDRTLESCEKFVAKEELPWKNLKSEEGGSNQLATYYGITGIPTAILVDQEGKVVSLRARGQELNRLLAELLGEPVVTEELSDTKQPNEVTPDEKSEQDS